MAFLDDLASVLVGGGLGTLGTDLFLSSRAVVPALPSGSTVHIIETGGTAPHNTHNSTASPAYLQPGAQITVRANDYRVAITKARAVYESLYGIRNEFIGSGWYLWVKPLQEPFDLGVEDNGQSRVAFNVIARYNKRPSP
jgi:hypothetical protein